MNKLQKIAEILGLTLNSNVVEEKLSAEAMTKDGAKIYTEAEGFIVGAAVMMVMEDGSMVPAMEGELIMEDDSVLVLDANGVILEIKPAEAEEEAAPAPEAPVAAEEMSADDNEEVTFTLSEEDYNALVERIAKLEEVLLASVEALSGTNKELTEKIEKLSAAPAAAPVKTRKPIVEENALASIKLPRKK